MKVSRHTVLDGLIRAHGWTRGVELGVWQASVFHHLLCNFSKLHLTGVDRWQPVNEYAGKDMAAAEELAKAIAERFGPRASILKMDTAAAAARFADGSIDFVFIDASHDTESVLAEIAAWRCKIAAGGALTGHDANLGTVRAALDAALPGWELLAANCWIYPVGGTDAAAAG